MAVALRAAERARGPRSAQHEHGRARLSLLGRGRDGLGVNGAVSAFAALGEGTVALVFAVTGERGWLRVQTRWGELMKSAVAARRWSGEVPGRDADTDGVGEARSVPGACTEVRRLRGKEYAKNATAYARGGYEIENDEYEEEEDEEEDEEELAVTRRTSRSSRLRTGRAENPESSICAVHPVASSISPPSSPPHPSASSILPATTTTTTPAAPPVPERHPASPAPCPPTFPLSEVAHAAQCLPAMHDILLPVFCNVVEATGVDSSGTTRKLFDPAMRGTHDARAEGRRPSGQARGNGSRARLDDETASTGSGSLPKRARIDNIESPPDSSTPGATAREGCSNFYILVSVWIHTYPE
ncbi:hypothetical protein B0H14DRAFT_3510953 [Mycena olivaceomarginata]|nr:hypothetical protein B0H14DRAFT_3510953 [Mycena olivaceomarginata]